MRNEITNSILALTFLVTATGCDNRGDTGIVEILQYNGVHQGSNSQPKQASFRVTGTRSGAAFDTEVRIPCSQVSNNSGTSLAPNVLQSAIEGALERKAGITTIVIRPKNPASYNLETMHDSAAHDCESSLS